jgi:hypothetical protein
LIASGDAATLAKIAALHVLCVGHLVPTDRETPLASVPRVFRPHV